MNGDEYRTLKNTLMNSNLELARDKGAGMVDYGGNTDWMDEVTRTSVSHQHYLSLTTSSKYSSTAASLTYNNYQGIVKKTEKEEINGRIATEFRHFDDMLKVNLNLAYTSKTQSPPADGGFETGSVRILRWLLIRQDGSYTSDLTR